VFQKGTNSQVDSYSGFYDNGRRGSTGMADWLRARGVDHLVVLGLATDYGVRFTVLDGLDEGFAVTVVRDGCRAINLEPGDEAQALAAMATAGAEVVDSTNLLGVGLLRVGLLGVGLLGVGPG
jgi:nicotinamidase/pyrazinamidase